MMDLCHVFMFGTHGDAEALTSLGLVENYRRQHPGQGTSNACFCFDNAYLELLFVDDQAALAALRRTRLSERSGWRTSEASPFGIAIRSSTALPFPTWEYRPAYLPDGMVIAVDRECDDINQPFVFAAPGSQRPDRWTTGLAGERQSQAGYLEITSIALFQPKPPRAALRTMEAAGLVLTHSGADSHRMVLSIARRDEAVLELALPALQLAGADES
jgi:hypothetical protein